MDPMTLALSTDDVKDVVDISFSDDFVNGTRTLAIILSGIWVLYILKDHLLPSKQPGMPMGQGGGGGSKFLTAAGLILLVEPHLINKLAVWPLQALITVAGFIPPLRDALDIQDSSGAGTVTEGGGGGYS